MKGDSSLASTISAKAVAAGLLSAFVGYASSVAVVIQGLTAMGADAPQIASALVALGIVMGLVAIGLSLRSRMPISIVWTTPGMALLAASEAPAGGFSAAVGAFVVAGALTMAAGLWAPLGRWIAAIPKALASAMLAGILLKLCLAPFAAVTQAPGAALLILAVWAAVGRVAKTFAVPAAAAAALAAMALDAPVDGFASAPLWPTLSFVAPSFAWDATIGLAAPLFVVTMASQNIPGLAVLATYGYRPAVRPIFLATGTASALAAPFGAPTVNLAAITAALCASPDADARPERRWQAAAAAGVAYVAFGGLAAVVATMAMRSPPILIEAVAGLALIGAFGSALVGAVQAEKHRAAALVTLLVTASGVSFAGIGSAFWGLLLGGVMYALHRERLAPQPAE